MSDSTSARTRILVVGSGTRFLSGISVYTLRLANALAASGARVSLLTMRQLLPTRLYPGRDRVGTQLTELERDPRVRMFDGIDWYWLPSMLRAVRWVLGERPEVMVLQWWSGTVLHSYLALAVLARLRGTRIVIEFHEVLDTGELRLPLVKPYTALVGSAVVRLADAFVVHSEFDRDLLATHYRLGRRPVTIVRHGPYDHYSGTADHEARAVLREAPAGTCNLLFFGVIRPYKGLEDLIDAFDQLTEAEVHGYWLTVVGETWEGWTLPAQKIAASRWRSRITFVNRYVHDNELDGYLGGADAVVLPYHRSSISGPLHVAITYGLPIVMTNVGGNAEAAGDYEGLRLVPVGDATAIAEQIRQLPALRGRRFANPYSWQASAEAYGRIADTLTGRQPSAVPAAPTSPAASGPTERAA
jgi:glycosyltransferase involved in cell wall biosynthesis